MYMSQNLLGKFCHPEITIYYYSLGTGKFLSQTNIRNRFGVRAFSNLEKNGIPVAFVQSHDNDQTFDRCYETAHS